MLSKLKIIHRLPQFVLQDNALLTGGFDPLPKGGPGPDESIVMFVHKDETVFVHLELASPGA